MSWVHSLIPLIPPLLQGIVGVFSEMGKSNSKPADLSPLVKQQKEALNQLSASHAREVQEMKEATEKEAERSKKSEQEFQAAMQNIQNEARRKEQSFKEEMEIHEKRNAEDCASATKVSRRTRKKIKKK